MALAEFFFPSSRRKKTKRSSRPPVEINISKNDGASIHPCVWISSSPESQNSYTCHHHPHRHRVNRREAPREQVSFEETSHLWDEDRLPNLHSAETPTLAPGRHPSSESAISPYREPCNNGDQFMSTPHRARQPPRIVRHDNPDSIHESPRFSHYLEAMRRAWTCFIGQTSQDGLIATGPDFHDRTICFRIMDQMTDEGDEDRSDGEREMVVVSSPGNIPWIMETIAPHDSGRQVIIQACTPQGQVQRGDKQFLASILPRGWPFNMVLVEE